MSEVSDAMMEAAREYLRRRLENENSYGVNLDDFLREAVEAICAIVVKYLLTSDDLMSGNIPDAAQREIDAVIEDLCDKIDEAVLLLSQDDREDKDWFIALMNRVYEDDHTFDDRLEEYSGKFGKQVLMACAALAYVGIRSSEWANEIMKNVRDLYGSSFVRSASSQRVSFFSPMKSGRGVPHNMAVALDYLGRQTISNAWMEYEYEYARDSGAKGYYVYRGSSYPCDECDAHVGYHSIDEGWNNPPFHSHCCCLVVYVY